MTPEQIKAVIEEELLELAPEADLDDLDHSVCSDRGFGRFRTT